jgi:hypothetical protein
LITPYKTLSIYTFEKLKIFHIPKKRTGNFFTKGEIETNKKKKEEALCTPFEEEDMEFKL